MNISPLHDRIVVKLSENKETTSSGIIIESKERANRGVVLACGKGKMNDEGKVFPLSVKVGDKVLFGKGVGSEIKVDGESLLIMVESDIYAIV